MTQGEATAAIDGRLVTGATLSDVAPTAARELGAAEGGALALYFGGSQSRCRRRLARRDASAAYPAAQVECYYGGQPAKEYVMSIDQ